MNTERMTALGVLAGALLASSCPARAADVTYERLLNPEPHNWLMVHRDYSAQRHSALDQINKSNVSQLQVAWFYPQAQTGFNPVVVDDVMYTAARGGLVAQRRRRLRNPGRHRTEARARRGRAIFVEVPQEPRPGSGRGEGRRRPQA